MKRTTIADVARRCGVSKTTVSVVLNESPAGSRVPPETHQRVRDTARELGYRPDWRARALTHRRTHTIGILYAPPMPLIVRGNYEGIMAGIYEVLTGRGYHVTFIPLGHDPAGWADLLADQRVDGCLVLSRLYEQLATLLRQVRLPAVLVNADSPQALPIVLPDDLDGGRQLTRHLLGLGHRDITFYLGDAPAHHSVTGRIAGYEQEMAAAGLADRVRIVRGPIEPFAATLKDPATRPTAVLAYTHFAAITLLRLCWEHDLKVPADLSVATFSDSYPVAEVVPPLTVMGLPTEEMGRTAARMVLEQIDTAGAAPPQRVVLGETLIVRRSTAAPPARS